MIYLLICAIFVLIIFMLLMRLFFLKKVLKNITQQLRAYNEIKTAKKLDIIFIDHDVEKLSEEINNLIDLHKSEKRKRMNSESELKQMIANMSHDLKTPLTALQGYLQMLENNNLPLAERNELLIRARNRAKRLEALIIEFFELSLLEANDEPLLLEQVDLRKITYEVLMSYYDELQKQKIKANIQIPEQPIYIVANEAALKRVLENLIANVTTHATGNMTLHIVPKGNEASLMIENEATQLTQHDVNHLFERFYKGDRSRNSATTGLGLAIAKKLMEKMHATITAQFHKCKLTIICNFPKPN